MWEPVPCVWDRRRNLFYAQWRVREKDVNSDPDRRDVSIPNIEIGVISLRRSCGDTLVSGFPATIGPLKSDSLEAPNKSELSDSC